MKQLTLVLGRIETLIRRQKEIFLLYFLAYFVCTMVFIFIYNNYMPHVIKSASNQTEDRYYRFSLEGDIPVSDGCLQFLSEYSFETAIFSHRLTGEETTEELTGYDVQAAINDQMIITRVSGRTDFTEEERAGEAVALLSDNAGLTALDLAGKTFSVIGTTGSWSQIIVPFNSFKAMEFKVDSLELITERVLSAEKAAALVEGVVSYFQVTGLIGSEQLGTDRSGEEAKRLLFICVIGGVMLLVFSYLVRFFLEETAYEDVVYRLVGAKRVDLISILLLETVLLNLLVGVAAVCFYQLTFPFLWDKLNFFTGMRLRLADMVLILACEIGMSVCILFPQIMRLSRTAVASVRQTI